MTDNRDLSDWFDRYTVDYDDFTPLDQAPDLITSLPGLPADADTSQPWDLLSISIPFDDPGTESTFDVPEMVGEPSADPRPSAFIRVIARYTKALGRMLKENPWNRASMRVALRLGDLQAASGQHAESLSTYREILTQAQEDPSGSTQAARRAAAVLQEGDLTNADSALLTDLEQLIPPASPEEAEYRGQVFRQLSTDAQETIQSLNNFDADIQDWMRIAPGARSEQTVARLEARAVENSAAARLQLAESAALNAPLPISILTEALLDTDHQLKFRPLAYRRGRRHRMRFADIALIESPLVDGSYADHIAAVLGERCHPKLDTTIRDVVYLTGSFPERSQVLIEAWRQEHDLGERYVIINCPYLHRTRAEDHEAVHAANPDAPAPYERFSGVAVTSLGWGGAADVGALLARAWGWGFAASTRSRLDGYVRDQQPFGDWTGAEDTVRHIELMHNLLSATTTMLDSLPDLTKRVFALDHPQAAIEALWERPLPGDKENPLALVMIQMSERRIGWVARHMLSFGGQKTVTDAEVQDRVEELLRTQDKLADAVRRHSPTVPVLIVELIDYDDDGYAHSATPNDPVDADFDKYFDTAELVRAQLEDIAAATVALPAPPPLTGRSRPHD